MPKACTCPQAAAEKLRGGRVGGGSQHSTQRAQHVVPSLHAAASAAATAAAATVEPWRCSLLPTSLRLHELPQPHVRCEDAHTVVGGQAVADTQGGLHKCRQQGGSCFQLPFWRGWYVAHTSVWAGAGTPWGWALMQLPQQAVQLGGGAAHIHLAMRRAQQQISNLEIRCNKELVIELCMLAVAGA